MSLVCQLLPHEVADGPRQMALDEALLDAVAATPGLAFFRTYEWSEPTLSLGYFQSYRDAEADPRFRDAAIVRRATGGGAIWHHHEVTYALVLPDKHPSARRGGSLYRDVHTAIATLFQALGAKVARRGDVPSDGSRSRPLLCFLDREPEDLVIGNTKVVGSAQRRRGSALLQHGSILLAHSPGLPDLRGASDLESIPGDASGWAEPLRRQIPEALGLDAERADIPSSVRQRAEELARNVYGNPDWTRRR